MVWLETPTNPLMKLADIEAVSKGIKSIRSDVILVVDNTFLTCYFQVCGKNIIISIFQNIVKLIFIY